MKNKFINKEFLILAFFIVLLIITSVYDFFVSDGSKLFRIGLNLITIILVYILFIKGFLKGVRVIYYINMIFVFLSMYLASICNFYSIENYDKFLHLLSGAIIAIIGYILFIYLTNDISRKEMNSLTPVIFVVIFATALAGIWEIWEFTTDSLFGLAAQNNNLRDTMWDIICGTVVGMITSIPIYISSKGRQIKLINKIIEEVERNKKS